MHFSWKQQLMVPAGVLLFASLSLAQTSSPQDHPGQPDDHTNVFMGGDHPKKSKDATTRMVKGKVTDGSGKPLDNAVVTLVNQDTHVQLTFFTKHGGQYYFDGLKFTTDYKLFAQYKDGKSVIRTLSQYDHAPNIVRILEVESASAPAEKPTQPTAAAKQP